MNISANNIKRLLSELADCGIPAIENKLMPGREIITPDGTIHFGRRGQIKWIADMPHAEWILDIAESIDIETPIKIGYIKASDTRKAQAAKHKTSSK